MGGSSMKVHPFGRGFWDNHQTTAHDSQALTLGCKRFRPLAPKVGSNNNVVNNTTTSTGHHNNNATFDLKSFIRPHCGPPKMVSPPDHKKDSASHQVGDASFLYLVILNIYFCLNFSFSIKFLKSYSIYSLV